MAGRTKRFGVCCVTRIKDISRTLAQDPSCWQRLSLSSPHLSEFSALHCKTDIVRLSGRELSLSPHLSNIKKGEIRYFFLFWKIFYCFNIDMGIYILVIFFRNIKYFKCCRYKIFNECESLTYLTGGMFEGHLILNLWRNICTPIPLFFCL